jgi:hypothetical protein
LFAQQFRAVLMIFGALRQRLCLPRSWPGRRPAPDARRGIDVRAGAAGPDLAPRGNRLPLALSVLFLGWLCLVVLPVSAVADPAADDLGKLRTEIQKEIAALKKQEAKLRQQFLDLDRKSQLLDRKSQLLDEQLRALRAARTEQLRGLRAAGTEQLRSSRGAGTGGGAVPPEVGAPGSAATISSSPTANASPSGTELAQAPSGGPSAPGPQGGQPAPPPAGGQSAPIQGPSAAQQQAKQVIETAPSLSSAGGVLTPKGQFVFDPQLEFDYWSQNQLGVNGFQIIPGITFGNIFVTRFEQNILTASGTLRYGVTDRLELNAKIPVVYNTGSTASLIPVGSTAELLAVNATGVGIGDLQFGGSYQINSGQNGWPIFIANGLFKTATGISPYQVPIITQTAPNGEFLAGTPERLATGTGFDAVTPSLTVLLPTAPGVLFANLQDQHNFAATQPVQNRAGGPATPVFLQPGEAPAVTFGIGFAVNDRTALTFSYQQSHVFPAFANHQEVAGSPYSYGTFNFGLGYQISQSTRVNLSVGIGAGPNTPVAKILLEVPYKFSL